MVPSPKLSFADSDTFTANFKDLVFYLSEAPDGNWLYANHPLESFGVPQHVLVAAKRARSAILHTFLDWANMRCKRSRASSCQVCHPYRISELTGCFLYDFQILVPYATVDMVKDSLDTLLKQHKDYAAWRAECYERLDKTDGEYVAICPSNPRCKVTIGLAFEALRHMMDIYRPSPYLIAWIKAQEEGY